MSHVDILDELPDVLVDIMVVTILGQVNFLLFDGAHQSLGIAILGRLADLSHADLGFVLKPGQRSQKRHTGRAFPEELARKEPVGRLVRYLRHVFRSGVAVSYCGRPVDR